MQKDWIDPTDFSSALMDNNKWNPDMVLRLYRGLNPLITRAEAIERFKSLNISKRNPQLPQLNKVDSYPTDFSKAVLGYGRWDWKRILEMYAEHGVDQATAEKHFKSLRITTSAPFAFAWNFPAQCLNEKFRGFVTIPAAPYPVPVPKHVFAKDKQEPPEWFNYLAKQHGYREAYLTVGYNLGEYYDKI